MGNVKKLAAGKSNSDSSAANYTVLKTAFAHYAKCEGVAYPSALKAIREKQIYLVVGEDSTSGKSIFAIPDLTFTCEYPPVESQLLESGGISSIQWRFSDDSVWIQIPSSLFEPSQQENLLTFYHALAEFRTKGTVDGIVFVFPAELMYSGTREELNVLSSRYQKQLILMNKNLGVNPPSYFLFDRADSLPGFMDIFGDESGRWDEQILGTAILPNEQNQPIREIVNRKLAGLTEQIRMIELKMLAREKRDDVRRGITAFTAASASMNSSLHDFITQMLSPAGSRDLNSLGGFFFAASSQNRRGESCSFFAKQLIRSVIPSNRAFVSHTSDRIDDFRKTTLKYSIISLVVIAIFVGLISLGSSKLKKWERAHIEHIVAPVGYDQAGLSNILILHKDYKSTMKFSKGKRTFLMRILGYNPAPVSDAVKKRLLDVLTNQIELPAEKYLQKKLRSAVIDGTSDLSNQFMQLKSALRAYLAGSDQGENYPDLYQKDLLKVELEPLLAQAYYRTATLDKKQKAAIDYLLNVYIDLLKTSVLKPVYVADAPVVSKTQERLVKLFDVQVVYETTIQQLKRTGNPMFLFDLVPEANEVNMNSGSSIHEVYTPKGWKNNVGAEIKKASGRITSVEKWVVGSHTINTSFANPDALYKGMVQFYLQDVATQWRQFVRSINLYRFNSLGEAGSVMTKLGSGSSAIVKTLEAFNTMNEEYKALGATEKEGVLFMEFANQMKFFGQLLANVAPYQELLGKTGEAINEQRKSGGLSSVFNGSSSDPLASLEQHIRRSMLPPLSQRDVSDVEMLLVQPCDRAHSALGKEVQGEVNEYWQRHVVQPFNQACAGKYPFAASSRIAEYSTVMDFFAPNGDFWKAYNNYFSGYASKVNGKYQSSGSSVRPEAISFINRADEIRRIFFQEDGAPRVWRFQITPTGKSQLTSAVMTIGDVTGNVVIPGMGRFEWPESKGSFAMKFTDNRGNPAAVQKYGEWVVMQELNYASLASNSQRFSNRFPAQFTIRSSALQLNLPAEITVSTPNHPFAENPFLGMKPGAGLTR